jgi:hypothetical protein
MRSLLKRVLCIAPKEDVAAGARLSERGDLLVNALIGFMVTALVVYYGTPTLLQALGTGKTDVTQQVFTGIVQAETLYYADHGTWAPSIAELETGGYLATPPIDAAAPVSGGTQASTFTITLETVNNTDSYIITDSTVHPPQTLAGLGVFTAAGKAPTTKCGDAGCTKMVYDPTIGLEGQ